MAAKLVHFGSCEGREARKRDRAAPRVQRPPSLGPLCHIRSSLGHMNGAAHVVPNPPYWTALCWHLCILLSQAAAQKSSRKAIVQSHQLLTYMHRHRTCLEGDSAMLTVLPFAAESPQVDPFSSGPCPCQCSGPLHVPLLRLTADCSEHGDLYREARGRKQAQSG